MLPAMTALFLGASLSGCAESSAAGSSVIQLKFGHASPPGSLVAQSAEEFVRRANEELAGRVNISLYGSGQLGGDEVLTIKLKLGTVDFALPSTTLSSNVESFGFFEIPYLIKDRDHLRRIEQEIFWPELAPRANEMGLEVIALWEHGFRQITNNARPITHPDDLRGIKLRTPSGYWRVTAFQAFGAHPTPMPLTEVFVALQTGVLDGQENPLPQIYASRFQDVQRYLSLTNHIYSPVFVTVGAQKWARHPADVREALERIAREVQAFSYEVAERMDSDLLVQLEAAGMVINEVDRAPWVERSQPVFAQFSRAVPEGQKWIDKALSLADEPAPAAAHSH
jgi:TRAP-type transport system periplasmic protein